MLASVQFLFVYMLMKCREILVVGLKPTNVPLRGLMIDAMRTRAELIGENALLRQQVIILKRSVKRPQVHKSDKLFLLVVVATFHV